MIFQPRIGQFNCTVPLMTSTLKQFTVLKLKIVYKMENVFITGSSRGIGYALGMYLTKKNYNVIFNGRGIIEIIFVIISKEM